MPSPVIPNIALPIASAPFSADLIREQIKTANAVCASRREVFKVYRDGAGRTRYELSLPAPDGAGSLAWITDMGAQYTAVLMAPIKSAYRTAVPPQQPDAALHFAILGIDDEEFMRTPGTRTSQTELLGKRTFEGIEFAGQRTTITIQANQHLTATDELWCSQEFGLIGLQVSSGPSAQTTVRIENFIKGEPVASLFVIPPDYHMQNPGTDTSVPE